MFLNYLWVAFILVAFFVALADLLLTGSGTVFGAMTDALFEQAKTGFELSIGLAGILTLWQGLLNVGDKSGLVRRFARLTAPFFGVLFPSIPKGHPVMGTMLMNFSANLLGLDNAATPLGLQTMQDLQKLNARKEEASDAMIMFLCINASGLTLIPITIIMYRLQMGSAAPSDVFLPILLATGASTLAAILMVAFKQKINLLRLPFLLPMFVLMALVALGFWGIRSISQEQLTAISTSVSHVVLLGMVALLVGSGLLARRNVYEDFIEGAKEGFGTAVKIIPYLVAILVAVGVFRASGALDWITKGISYMAGVLGGMDTSWVDALPTMVMKPLSGSGARGLMIEAMQNYGPDSFVGRLVCLVQGSSDTTFYIISLYYGSVAIKKIRYTLGISLLADLVGMIASVSLCYFFYF